MMITERQEKILNTVVQEYIYSARPVGSQLLEKKREFGICPATIRAEMQKLTSKGFLCQPHTSAGRVPTDKGYRFFVDRLLKQEKENREFKWQKEIEDSLAFIRNVTKFLAEESSGLALGYAAEAKIIWKEGWGDVLQEPEFVQPGFAASFASMIDDFEENIKDFFLLEPCLPVGRIQIYIGKENPIVKTGEFSIIASVFGKDLLAILGPKRMSYNKNIHLFYDLWRKI